MIVTAAQTQLLILIVDAAADRMRRAEVKWRARDGTHFTRGNQGGIDRREAICIDLQCLPQNRTQASPVRL